MVQGFSRMARPQLSSKERLQGMGEEKSKAAPVINRTFASRKLAPGETWKVYIHAHHPEGGMKFIHSVVEQPGAGVRPAGVNRIPKEAQKELSGYLYLKTAGTAGLEFASLVLTIQIQDRHGNFSNSVSLSLSFNPLAQPAEPPPGVFQDKELGPILIPLSPGFPSP